MHNPTETQIADKCLEIMLNKIEDARHVYIPDDVNTVEKKITFLIEAIRQMNNIPDIVDNPDYDCPTMKYYEHMSFYRSEAEMCLVYGVDDVDEICFE